MGAPVSESRTPPRLTCFFSLSSSGSLSVPSASASDGAAGPPPPLQTCFLIPAMWSSCALICLTASEGIPHSLALAPVYLVHLVEAVDIFENSLQSSSRATCCSCAVLMRGPYFSTSPRSLANSAKQGGIWPPP